MEFLEVELRLVVELMSVEEYEDRVWPWGFCGG